jgi:hypothetical protein
MNLDHRVGPIDVDGESRQPIRLVVDQTVSGGPLPHALASSSGSTEEGR